MVCNTLEILGAVNQYIDGLLREGRSSSALAMESRLSCGNPSIVTPGRSCQVILMQMNYEL